MIPLSQATSQASRISRRNVIVNGEEKSSSKSSSSRGSSERVSASSRICSTPLPPPQPSQIRIAYLHSEPLCRRDAGHAHRPEFTLAKASDLTSVSSATSDLIDLTDPSDLIPVDVLNTEAEFRCLCQAAEELEQHRSESAPPTESSESTKSTPPPSHVCVGGGSPSLLLQPLTASVRALRSLLTVSGASVLHFGGHGFADGSLLLESPSGDGTGVSVAPAALGQLFDAGRRSEGGAQPTLLAILSACHSQAAGEAFVAAGVHPQPGPGRSRPPVRLPVLSGAVWGKDGGGIFLYRRVRSEGGLVPPEAEAEADPTQPR
uniref:CHAT domain-containing protein n=1 Tax=Corethron hystrix TaxID=216773 RepID=A0A7S1C1G4_9STRA|mmetsp:Transcript_7735/g.16784  ORF Transcript_7735/g.16784 Transcript_7735/m.16784 type:complete len:319 (+) Transcript_7735:63-1019(+)